MTLTVHIPLPPACLNPNRKGGRHWGVTNAAKAKYRHDCWALAKEAAGPAPSLPDGPLALALTFVLPTKRRPDADNLLAACKAGLDGIAAALKVDDSRFEPVTIRRVFGAKPGAVVVEVA